MSDVPVNLVDLLFEFIEDYLCPLVFLAINVHNNVFGKYVDALNLVS